MKRKILAGLLTLCMAAGMAVPAAAATTPAEQEQGAEDRNTPCKNTF